MDQHALRQAFIDEAERRGLHTHGQAPDGRVILHARDREVLVGLENLARQLHHGPEADVIARFMDQVLAALAPLPRWPYARAGIRFVAAQPPTEEVDVLAVPVTERLVGVVAHVAGEGAEPTWVGEGHVAAWGISDEELLATASFNMGRQLDRATITVHRRGALRVGVLELDGPHKASLIFAPNLREKLEAPLGWPVLAALPARDYLLLFRAEDRDAALAEVGPAVLREYRASPHALTTEILRLSEEGYAAMGAFEVAPAVTGA